MHGGGPGVERIAAQWAERNGVHQVVCKPDWNAHGRAAPFRRNDELLNLLPKGVIAFPGSGITDNLVDKAVKLGIPVHAGRRVVCTASEGPRRFAGAALSFWSSPRAPPRTPSLRASPAAPRFRAASPRAVPSSHPRAVRR